MTATDSSKEPFSFKELLDAENDDEDHADAADAVRSTTVTVEAGDGVSLAVHVYEPTTTADDNSSGGGKTALVFYHGGGAHAGAGYRRLGRGLAAGFGVTVFLPDIRGHGASGGPRGDAPSADRVWEDTGAVLAHVAGAAGYDRVFLGGHSSGGGLVLNYASSRRAGDGDNGGAPVIAGYILVAPELGYKSGTARPGRTDFASVNIPAFIANGIFGVLGHSKAVRFRYPPSILDDDPGMVGFNTVNMANAITPDAPREQMAALCGGGGGGGDKGSPPPPPVGLWVGSDDELFVADTVAGFVTGNDDGGGGENKNTAEVLPGKTHLGILVDVHEPIGRWISGLTAGR